MKNKSLSSHVHPNIVCQSYIWANHKCLSFAMLFISRRGKCYSDNATNFIDANCELKKLYNFLFDYKHATKSLVDQQISWDKIITL